MPMFNIPVSWREVAIVKVEAETLEAAINKLKQPVFPVRTEKVSASYHIDIETECYAEN